jgi:hypothetical protein
MTTVRDLLTRSLKTIQVLGTGEAMSADDASDALFALNTFIELANLDPLMPPAHGSVTIPLVPGQSSWTVGPTGMIVTTRPVSIVSGYVRQTDGTDRVFQLIERIDYDRISHKTLGGTMTRLYYEPTYPNGTVTLVPPATSQDQTLVLTVLRPLSPYTTLDDLVDLPPGYQAWLQYRVAQRLAPEYGVPWTAELQMLLTETEAAIKSRQIVPMPIAQFDQALLIKEWRPSNV